jgi:hypothetical protein
MFEPTLLRVPCQDWYCPNCGATDRTLAMPPNSSQYHTCPRLHSLSAPMVRAGVKAKVEAVEREDYLSNDTQATGDDGKVYMLVRTTRDEGTDVSVNPGVARMRIT